MSEILKPEAEQLAAILADHARWLRGDGGSRADLSGADLSGADLSGANLSRADLSRADLRGADLYGANLGGADLYRANLSGADLSGADLSGADLRGADLYRANLYGANLYRADLRRANLRRANLSGADLRGANLYRADLSGADLRRANLNGVNNADLAKSMTEILPREGEVIGWKRCAGGVLVKLRVPPGAKRSNATGRKCRAEFVEVLEVVGATEVRSQRDAGVVYRVGETVACHAWEPDRFIECAGGIHFFLTREEAAAYDWS